MTTTPNTPGSATSPKPATPPKDCAGFRQPNLRIVDDVLTIVGGPEFVVLAPMVLDLRLGDLIKWSLCRIVSGQTIPADRSIELEPGRWSWCIDYDKTGSVLVLRHLETGVEIKLRTTRRQGPTAQEATEVLQ